MVKADKSWLRKRKVFHDTYRGTEWQHVVFTDEKSFGTKPSGKISVYSRTLSEHQNKYKHQKYNVRATCKVWGCFTSHGVGPLIKVPKSMNSEQYSQIVLNKAIGSIRKQAKLFGYAMRPPSGWIFQQDNAAYHVGPKAKEFFSQHKVPVMVWPPSSPDLNPMENLWSIIDHRVKEIGIRRGGFSNDEELFAVIQRVWNDVKPKACNKLSSTMDDRIKSLGDANYHYINY